MKVDRSDEAGFGFADGGVGVEEELDAGDTEDISDAMIQADERELAAGFVAGDKGADESADGHGIDGRDLGEVNDDFGRGGSGEGFVKFLSRFGGDGAFDVEDGEAVAAAGPGRDLKRLRIHGRILIEGTRRSNGGEKDPALGSGLLTRARCHRPQKGGIKRVIQSAFLDGVSLERKGHRNGDSD